MNKRIFIILTAILIIMSFLGGCGISKDKEISTESAAATQVEKKSNVPKVKGKPTVLIDAGHGFDDPGCTVELLERNEAEITFSIAKSLKEELEPAGVKVMMTHNSKRFPSAKTIKSSANNYGVDYTSSRIIDNNIFSAYERVIFASVEHKKNPIDLMISIHVNSIEGHPEVSRYELYYYENNPFAEDLNALCGLISGKLDNTCETFATVSKDSYTVTRYCEFPSLLIETGYATNHADADTLNSEAWRKKLAETLAIGIAEWFNTQEEPQTESTASINN